MCVKNHYKIQQLMFRCKYMIMEMNKYKNLDYESIKILD